MYRHSDRDEAWLDPPDVREGSHVPGSRTQLRDLPRRVRYWRGITLEAPSDTPVSVCTSGCSPPDSGTRWSASPVDGGVDHVFAARHEVNIGAEIMGRGKFGPPRAGPWTAVGTDEEWRGWWGPNPPFHTPVFVLTHHPRPSIEMEGGTIFHFIDASPQEALNLAREAADGRDVRIGGGPATVREFLAADLIDVLHLVQVPIVLGRGVRLWDGLEGIEERYDIEAVSSPSGVTHLTFTRREPILPRNEALHALRSNG